MFEYIIIGSCLELLGVQLAFDALAIPDICSPEPTCATTSLYGPPLQVSETECLIDVGLHPEYEQYWCQPSTVNGVEVTTPCLNQVTSLSQAPYSYRAWTAALICPDFDVMMGWCVRENVCTPADELAELCTVTP